MPGLFLHHGLLFAQDVGNNWGGLLMLLPIFPLFYFLIWRPQQQQEKQRRAMVEALKKNDKIVTAGGIFGTVVSVDQTGDKLVVRIDDDKGVKVTMTRSSVTRVLESTSEKTAEAS